MDKNYILELADKFNAERTWFDGELVSVTFTISHLEKFAEALNPSEQEPIGYYEPFDDDDHLHLDKDIPPYTYLFTAPPEQSARIKQLEDGIRKLIDEKEAQILGLESKLKEL